MALEVFTSSDEQWSFAEQVTWGTALADNATANGILTEGFGIDSAINFRNPPRTRAQRFNNPGDVQADQKGVVYQSNGASMPALDDSLDYLLYGCIQNVIESTLSAQVHQKTFTFPKTQPDFTSNAGEFFTMWGNSGVGTTDQKMYDVIVSELVLTCSPGNNEGQLTAAPVFMGRNHSDAANQSGSIIYPTQSSSAEYMFYDIIATKLGGNDIVLGDNGITLTIRNNAAKIGQDSGVFESFVLSRYDVELSIHCLWDANTRALVAAAKAGTTTAYQFEWGVTGADGNLDITGSGKISEALNVEHAIDGNFYTIPIIGAGIFGSSPLPLSVIMTTANDRSWASS